MFDLYSVSFIGHREIDNLFQAEEKLEEVIRDLIETKDYVDFYVGRNGDFDIAVASVIKRIKKESGCKNCRLILVLPYSSNV